MKRVLSVVKLLLLFAVLTLVMTDYVDAAPTIGVSYGGTRIGEIRIDTYKELVMTNPDRWGVEIKARFVLDEECPNADFRWIQRIVTNAESGLWYSDPPTVDDEKRKDDFGKYEYLDPWKKSNDPYKDNDPFYRTDSIKDRVPDWIKEIDDPDKSYEEWFSDEPKRTEKRVYENGKAVPVTWKAETALVCVSGNEIMYIGSFTWGWTRFYSNDGSKNYHRLMPISNELGEVSDYLKDLVEAPWKEGNHDCCVPAPGALSLASFAIILLGWMRRSRSIL